MLLDDFSVFFFCSKNTYFRDDVDGVSNSLCLMPDSIFAACSEHSTPSLFSMYGRVRESPSSCKKLSRIVFSSVGYQFGKISLYIINTFNAEMFIIFSNTAIGHRFVFLLQL